MWVGAPSQRQGLLLSHWEFTLGSDMGSVSEAAGGGGLPAQEAKHPCELKDLLANGGREMSLLVS